MKPVYFVLIFALISNAVANILIKEGMKAKVLEMGDIIGTVKAMLFNPTVMAGLFFFGLALAAYSFVLSQVKLSVAYPIMTSMGFLIVISYSFIFLHESVTALQLGGLSLILIGVWMVSTNMT